MRAHWHRLDSEEKTQWDEADRVLEACPDAECRLLFRPGRNQRHGVVESFRGQE